MAIEIPDSAAFYVRTGLNRGLMRAKKDIVNIAKALENDEVPEALKDSAEGSLAHVRQWYREAVDEYQKMPENIRPDKDLLSYDPMED